MKVLVLLGSLRKKNTYNAVKLFESIHLEKDPLCDYEYLSLKDHDLKLCRGCFLCLSKGETYCPLKDNLQEIVDKMNEADVIILASPNYVMNVNWLTKNFIDRMAYSLHRPMFFDKRFVLIVTSGNFMGAKQAVKALSALVSGGKIVGKLMLFTAPELSEKKKEKQMKKFRKDSHDIVMKLRDPYQHKADFGNVMWFSAFKASHDISKKTLPADYEYYKDKEYFIDVPLKASQKRLIRFTTSLMRRFTT